MLDQEMKSSGGGKGRFYTTAYRSYVLSARLNWKIQGS